MIGRNTGDSTVLPHFVLCLKKAMKPFLVSALYSIEKEGAGTQGDPRN